MKLYTAPRACSTASHIALEESGADYDVSGVRWSDGGYTVDGRPFQEINPKGMVPALEISPGNVLTENVAILQFIADRSPGSGLAPEPGSMERYRLQEWLGFINSDVHRAYTIQFKTSTPNETSELFRNRISAHLAHVSESLSGHPYLMGARFTVADCYLFTVLSWSDAVGVDLSPWPVVSAYQDRIGDRDSVRAVLEWESHEQG